MKKVILDKDEMNIEKNAEKYISLKGNDRKNINDIITKAKKSKSISLRVNNSDLNMLKQKAFQQGMPYQTLLTTVIHKYVTNSLLEKDEAVKIFKIIKKMPV